MLALPQTPTGPCPAPTGKQHVVCMVGKVPDNVNRKKIPCVLTLPQASLPGTEPVPFEEWHLWPLQAVERVSVPPNPNIAQCTEAEHQRVEQLFNELKEAANTNKGGAQVSCANPTPIMCCMCRCCGYL